MVLMVFLSSRISPRASTVILRRQIAFGDGRRDIGDVADLVRQIAGHRVDAIGEIFPGTRYASHVGLSAELAFGSHFAGDARHFGGEGIELIHHGVDGVLQLQNFAAHVHGDFAREVAFGNGGRDFRDVTDLVGQVGGHGVDGVGQIFPGAADAFHVSLSAELALPCPLRGQRALLRRRRR